MNAIEIFGLISGTLAIALLIKQNIWTWPIGIAYTVASIYIFFDARLYADLALHIFFLVMNFYGWYYWLNGGVRAGSELIVSNESKKHLIILLAFCAITIFISGSLFATYTDADLPYWDNTTSVLSLLAIWLQSRKKIESWVLWFIVDILAAGIYFYKGIYLYSLLYTLYIGMAFMGYAAWQKSYRNELRNYSYDRP
ncbi:MAG: nicotinamide riboside transporter PnuC [Gammaproteobacteria bacterium]|nr:nicotinamide riboside transporter PnuC [Gammaproteobacteria bacterium]